MEQTIPVGACPPVGPNGSKSQARDLTGLTVRSGLARARFRIATRWDTRLQHQDGPSKIMLGPSIVARQSIAVSSPPSSSVIALVNQTVASASALRSRS